MFGFNARISPHSHDCTSPHVLTIERAFLKFSLGRSVSILLSSVLSWFFIFCIPSWNCNILILSSPQIYLTIPQQNFTFREHSRRGSIRLFLSPIHQLRKIRTQYDALPAPRFASLFCVSQHKLTSILTSLSTCRRFQQQRSAQ